MTASSTIFCGNACRRRGGPKGRPWSASSNSKHRSLLMRRQRALEKLVTRASHTLVQVTRRLGILDREYGFIRTNIFWVRDQEPIGLLTLTQGAREFNVLVKGLLRLAKETVKPNSGASPRVSFWYAWRALAVPGASRRVLGVRSGISGADVTVECCDAGSAMADGHASS